MRAQLGCKSSSKFPSQFLCKVVWDFEVLRNFSYSRGVRGGVWSSNSETTVRPKVLGSHKDSSVPPPPWNIGFFVKIWSRGSCIGLRIAKDFLGEVLIFFEKKFWWILSVALGNPMHPFTRLGVKISPFGLSFWGVKFSKPFKNITFRSQKCF